MTSPDIRIKLEPHEVSTTPLDPDAIIVKHIQGRTYRALVPATSLQDGQTWLPARLTQKSGHRVAIQLPPRNHTSPTWVITEKQLDSILLPDI